MGKDQKVVQQEPSSIYYDKRIRNEEQVRVIDERNC